MRISDWSSDVCSSDLHSCHTPVMEVGGLRVASITDRIDGPSNWTIERDVHALILYEAGGYHWLETWLGDMRTSLGDPLPGEMWLRSEERRVGKEWGSTCRFWWSPVH